jgi:hypothetical protein
MAGRATHLDQFVGWHFGWDKRDDNFLWFWLKNTGMFIPLLIAGMVYWYFYGGGETPEPKKKKRKKGKKTEAASESPAERHPLDLLLFSVPFIVLFVISNAVRLAPWEWDNIKVLIYWYLGSIPFVAWLLARMWETDRVYRAVSAAAMVVLMAAGALDVWRVVSGGIDMRVFDQGAVEIAEKIKLRTPPNAVFLNAPTYNSAVVLSGRLSVIRYPGHLMSHGIDYKERENDVRRIYAGGGTSEILVRKLGADYALVGPEEKSALSVNEAAFARYPVVAEAGGYRVYKLTPDGR